MTDIKFQGCAPIEWPGRTYNGYPLFSIEDAFELFEDENANKPIGVICEDKNSKFLIYVHQLIESHIVTVHLLNDGDEKLLTDPIICKTARRLRALVLSPISSQKLTEACDILITASG